VVHVGSQSPDAAGGDGLQGGLGTGSAGDDGVGVLRTVVEVDGDAITLESAGSRSIWIRGAVLKLAEPPVAVPDDEADADGTGTVEVPDDISSLDPGDTGAPPSK